MKRILKYVLKHPKLVAIPSVAMLLSIILDMFNPYLSKIMIDKVIAHREFNLLPSILIFILLIALLRSVFGYIKEYVSDYLATEVSKELKMDLFKHIESLPYSYFDGMNTGELMSRIGEDVDNVWRTVGFGFRLLVENGIYFITASAILIYLNPILAVSCLIIMIPIAFIALKLEKEADGVYSKISDQTATMNTTAQEDISGMKLVKAFAREKYEILKFLDHNKTNYNLNVEQTKIFSRHFPRIEFLTNVSLVIMICVGGIFVINKSITIGTLVAFNGYIWMLIWPMRLLGWLTNMLAQNNASAVKIFKIMDTEPLIKDSDNPIYFNGLKKEVKFEHVNFKYNEEEVLRDISFTAPLGTTIAIMGTTGSGKSSIINLIGRYYDVESGSVLLDGVDVRKLYLKDLRGHMAVVSQDVFLFSESVYDNIKLGKENATEEDVITASKLACSDEFIREFENGYDTLIGERGIGLSGGQKQRISIARALIRNANILVLDDATSALDMETEYSLLKNLSKKEKDRITFIIAHRISAVKNADQIIFLENGQIKEKGTHEELISLKGKYYEVYREQFKDFDALEGEVV